MFKMELKMIQESLLKMEGLLIKLLKTKKAV